MEHDKAMWCYSWTEMHHIYQRLSIDQFFISLHGGKLWTLYFVYTPHILIAIWKKWKIHDSAPVYQIIKLLHVWKYSQFIAGQYNSRYLGHVRVYTHIHRYKIHDFWLEYKGQKAKTCIRLSHVWWFIITPQTTLNLVYVSYAPHFLPWKANRRKIQYVRLYVLIVDQRTAKNPRNSIQIEQIWTPYFLFAKQQTCSETGTESVKGLPNL